jgi:hypothetical protein
MRGTAPVRAVAIGSKRGGVAVVDLRLEVVVVPVSDVDRAKGFYESLGGARTPIYPVKAASGSCR